MNRVNYKTLKQWFFEDAYQWCQEKFYDGKVHKWHNDESDEWGGGALDSFYGNFKLPIEKLMLYVVYLILRSGRNPYGHRIILNEIDEILCSNNIIDLTSILEEERQEFLYDLNLVLNNREIEE